MFYARLQHGKNLCGKSADQIHFELVHKLTGEVFELEPINRPESVRTAGRVINSLRNAGVDSVTPELCELLGLPEGYEMVPACECEWCFTEDQENFAERTRRYEQRNGPIPFGFAGKFKRQYPDLDAHLLREILVTYSVPWNNAERVKNILLVIFCSTGTICDE